MIGILNETCIWCKQSTMNDFNEPTEESEPVTLKCSIGKDVKLKQTDLGLIKTDEKYYILHFGEVQDGDTLDGYVVAVSPIKDLMGNVAYYKAVVVDA